MSEQDRKRAEEGGQPTEAGRIWAFCLDYLKVDHSKDTDDGADPPSVITAALAQARREGEESMRKYCDVLKADRAECYKEGYRQGIIELRDGAGKKWRGCIFADGNHEGITVDDLYDEADRLLSESPKGVPK